MNHDDFQTLLRAHQAGRVEEAVTPTPDHPARADAAEAALLRPSVLYGPKIMIDGDMWCVLLGENLQAGVAAFGETPALAMAAFDKAFNEQRTPAAVRANREGDQPWPFA